MFSQAEFTCHQFKGIPLGDLIRGSIGFLENEARKFAEIIYSGIEVNRQNLPAQFYDEFIRAKTQLETCLALSSLTQSSTYTIDDFDNRSQNVTVLFDKMHLVAEGFLPRIQKKERDKLSKEPRARKKLAKEFVEHQKIFDFSTKAREELLPHFHNSAEMVYALISTVKKFNELDMYKFLKGKGCLEESWDSIKRALTERAHNVDEDKQLENKEIYTKAMQHFRDFVTHAEDKHWQNSGTLAVLLSTIRTPQPPTREQPLGRSFDGDVTVTPLHFPDDDDPDHDPPLPSHGPSL